MRKLGATVLVVGILATGGYATELQFSEIPKLEKKHEAEFQDNMKLKKTILELETQQQELKDTNNRLANEYKNLESEYGEAQKTFESQLAGYKHKISSMQTATPHTMIKATSIKKPAQAKKTLKGFEVTYYNDYGYTKSGHFVKDGLTIAVDPRVIPLGTWVRIKMPDGSILKRRADDTGRAVKGKIIDVYKHSSNKHLRDLGRVHGVEVTILK